MFSWWRRTKRDPLELLGQCWPTAEQQLGEEATRRAEEALRELLADRG